MNMTNLFTISTNLVINSPRVATVLDIYTNMVNGGRWISTANFIHVFSPEIFFFLSNTLLFLVWFYRSHALKKQGHDPLARLFNTYTVERYMRLLVVINVITIWLLVDGIGFPLSVGGYMQAESLMFQVTYYTQALKVFTLVLFSLFLYGGRLYFVKTFFPTVFNVKTNQVMTNLRFLEYFLIMTFGVGFTLLLISSANLISVALTMEGLSFCLYILSGFRTQSKYALEAAVKYFFYGAVVFGLFACGMLFIYIEIGGLSFEHIVHNSPTFYSYDATVLYLGKEVITYVPEKGSLFFMCGVFLILASLIFKVGGAPFHFWVADVYEGAPYPTTAFMASIGKVGFYAVLFKLCTWVFVGNLVEWQPWLLGAGALSLIIGSLGALKQKRIKRFFAYSSIVHVGFLLIALGIGEHHLLSAAILYDAPQSMFITNSLIGALLYLAVYVVTVLLMFILLMNLAFKTTGKPPVYFTDLQGLLIRASSKKNGLFVVAVGLVVLLLSMAGIPPFFGFFTKFYILSVLVKYQLNVLICIVIVVTVIGAFYYLRLLKIFFFEDFNIKSPQILARREIILLSNKLNQSDQEILNIQQNYKRTMFIMVALSIFVVLIFPWVGFESFLNILQKSTLSVIWSDLPLVLLQTDFVNHMLPHTLPFHLQYIYYNLNYTDMVLDNVTVANYVTSRPIVGKEIPNFYQYVTFLGNLWRGDNFVAQAYLSLFPETPKS